MKSLVIYFSHTGENYMSNGIENIEKGNTEKVAEKIHDLIGADLWKAETIKQYPYHYQECCDVAQEELKNNSRPELKNLITDIKNYDVIYIGGPVWWGHLPMALFTALETLDFTGKVVKPFTTHEGSGLGNVMDDIHKLCTGADIKNGLAIRGSEADNCTLKLQQWIED